MGDFRRSCSCDAFDTRRDESPGATILIHPEGYRRERASRSGERAGSLSCARVHVGDASSGSPLVPSGAATHSSSSSCSESRRVSSRGVGERSSVGCGVDAHVDDAPLALPDRKPYINLDVLNAVCVGATRDDPRELLNDSLCDSRVTGSTRIKRTQSFKEGLDFGGREYSNRIYGLSRTQSFNDGLATDYGAGSNTRSRLERVPSVDEILESVKSLRSRKGMVKSNPDLRAQPDGGLYSSSLPRHKNSKGKASPRTSSLLGVRYNGPSSKDPVYERVDSDYERIPEGLAPCYENVHQKSHYENTHSNSDSVYDSPRSRGLHYENMQFDCPVYENVPDDEPTYMNVANQGGSLKRSSGRSTLDGHHKTDTKGKSKSKSKSSANNPHQTYDVPKPPTHIYDTPPKQVRQVVQAQPEYDTPKNNRSVLPESTQIVLKAKNEQKKKIDDIFADCDRDSLEGDRDLEHPDIPSPDYDSEEEVNGIHEDELTSEYPDEGLGETEIKYYADDQGLEVILEEPEEDYCSSTSEDDLRRSLKGSERRSLDGSEGIGSDSQFSSSSTGSDLGGDEDCASSGIHSEDTPSPGPPEREEDSEGGHSQGSHVEEDRIQKDRCVEVYPETVRQRQRNMAPSPSKVDIKNWGSGDGDSDAVGKMKKYLPSVKALRSQFENGRPQNHRRSSGGHTDTLRRSSNSSLSSLTSSSLEEFSSVNSHECPSEGTSSSRGESDKGNYCDRISHALNDQSVEMDDEHVEPIFNQFKQVDEELRQLMSKPPSSSGWNPKQLLRRLYYVPDAPKPKSQGPSYINMEGYLEKLPSGRRKATFWNAWKRRFFVAKDGVLYYYQNSQSDKPSMKMTLMGGKIESMESNLIGVDDGEKNSKEASMIGIDDGKGHYVVVRCTSHHEAEKWKKALESHTIEDFGSQYINPWPMPTNPTLLRDTIIIDLGSCSVRAGLLASQPTLPQIFYPTVMATDRETRKRTWGYDALTPEVRASSSVSFPVRPSHKISKYSVDLNAVSDILQKTFADMKVDPKNYNIQLSVPRVLNPNTQVEILKIMFDKLGVKSVNMTHQSILALYAYNATSGIVVDIGERMDIVPVIDGYIVDGGVSRVPYGGYRILDHLRQFLYMRNISLVNHVESYILRYVLENMCYCAHHYNTEKARCAANPENFEKILSLKEFFQTKSTAIESVSLDFGRFQATEGLFNPDAWGMDHPGLHKLVHKAIQECSMDIRKEMSRSIFVAGGVSQLPGLTERLTTELDNLTPPAIRPKVHASPYRYHAAYIGACVLAESPAFAQSRIARDEWIKQGNGALRKWTI